MLEYILLVDDREVVRVGVSNISGMYAKSILTEKEKARVRFVGKIENNFSPFITARVGGVLSFDGKETGSFKERWEEPDIHLNQGGFLGLGIDFKMVGQTSVSVMLGFELLPLKTEIDQMQDYSGTLIHISFNRPRK